MRYRLSMLGQVDYSTLRETLLTFNDEAYDATFHILVLESIITIQSDVSIDTIDEFFHPVFTQYLSFFFSKEE